MILNFNLADFADFFKTYGQMIVTLCQVAVTLFIGLAAWTVSKKQTKIAEAKFCLEMYTHRKDIFIKIFKILTNPNNRGETDFEDMIDIIPEASFLFEKDIAIFMHEITTNLRRIHVIQESIINNNADIKQTNKELENIEKWFSDETVLLRARFKPYFDFSTSSNLNHFGKLLSKFKLYKMPTVKFRAPKDNK